LFNTNIRQPGNQYHYHKGRKIHNYFHIPQTRRSKPCLGMNIIGTFAEGILCSAHIRNKPGRQMDIDRLQHIIEITTPADSHYDITNGVLQNQRPADDPGDDFAKNYVRISISAARYRNAGGKLCIAKCGEAASDSRYDKKKYNPRTAIESSLSYGTENTGANNGSNTHHH